MKLREISEAKSRLAIRETALALGDLINFIYGMGSGPERKAMDNWLKEPLARTWDQTKWVIDSAMQQGADIPDANNRMKKWMQLKNTTSPIVASSVHDIDPDKLRGTPRQQVALTRSVRDKFKRALGPQGYVSSLADAGKLSPSRLRSMLKDVSQDGLAMIQASQGAMPGIKPVSRF